MHLLHLPCWKSIRSDAGAQAQEAYKCHTLYLSSARRWRRAAAHYSLALNHGLSLPANSLLSQPGLGWVVEVSSVAPHHFLTETAAHVPRIGCRVVFVPYLHLCRSLVFNYLCDSNFKAT